MIIIQTVASRIVGPDGIAINGRVEIQPVTQFEFDDSNTSQSIPRKVAATTISILVIAGKLQRKVLVQAGPPEVFGYVDHHFDLAPTTGNRGNDKANVTYRATFYVTDGDENKVIDRWVEYWVLPDDSQHQTLEITAVPLACAEELPTYFLHDDVDRLTDVVIRTPNSAGRNTIIPTDYAAALTLQNGGSYGNLFEVKSYYDANHLTIDSTGKTTITATQDRAVTIDSTVGAGLYISSLGTSAIDIKAWTFAPDSSIFNGNKGITSYASQESQTARAGGNVAVIGEARNGRYNVALLGTATVTETGLSSPTMIVNCGVMGIAHGGYIPNIEVGGYFGLNAYSVQPTVESAALIANNASRTSPIFLAQDEGSTVFMIADGGAVTATSTIAASNLSGTNTGDQAIALTGDVTGTWAVGSIATTLATVTSAKGGTGFTTYATGDIIYASGTNTLAKLAVGTNTHVLTLAGGVPTWAAPAGSLIQTLGSISTTQTFDPAAGSIVKFTLGASITVNFTSYMATYGARLVMRITQSTGSHTITWGGSNIKFPGGVAPTLTTTAGATDILEFLWDGTQYSLLNTVLALA